AHPRGQHPVEQLRARCRQQQAALVAAHAAAGKHRQCRRHVAFAAPEALRAEPVGHALGRDPLQPGFDRLSPALHLAQREHEAVARPRPAREPLRVPGVRDHAQPVILETLRLGIPAAGKMHAEALAGDGVTVLQPRIAHGLLGHPRPAGDPARGLDRVHAALLHGEQQVLAAAAGLEPVELLDEEILRRAADDRPQHRLPPGPGQAFPGGLSGIAHARTSRQAAWAAMPSSRPMWPSLSLVVALTLIASTSTCRSAAISSRIASACGPIFGRSQTMVMSALPRRHPRSPMSSRQRRRNMRLSASFHCGSLGGKWVPMSPMARAPNMASHSAWRATSPSLWATNPRPCGMRTPPMVTWSPSPKACTSKPWPMRRGMVSDSFVGLCGCRRYQGATC